MPVTKCYRARHASSLRDKASYCFDCGASTMMQCKHCADWIVLNSSYCGGCGKPLPWTEYALATAREYADEIDDLSAEDKTALKNTFEDLTVETARTSLAASRFMKLMKKTGPPVLETLRNILVDVMADTASKVIMGGKG